MSQLFLKRQVPTPSRNPEKLLCNSPRHRRQPRPTRPCTQSESNVTWNFVCRLGFLRSQATTVSSFASSGSWPDLCLRSCGCIRWAGLCTTRLWRPRPLSLLLPCFTYHAVQVASYQIVKVLTIIPRWHVSKCHWEFLAYFFIDSGEFPIMHPKPTHFPVLHPCHPQKKISKNWKKNSHHGSCNVCVTVIR